MIIKIITDLHIYGPHELPDAREIIKQPFDFAIGDIFDIKNCPEKLIREAKQKEGTFYDKFYDVCVEGNHDSKFCKSFLTMREKDVMLVHGHFFLYDKIRIEEINKAKPKYDGIGMLRYNVVKWFHKLNPYGYLSKEDMRKAAAFAKSKSCSTIIFGHVHPEKAIYDFVDGVRIICLPRGYSEVEV